MEKNLIVQIYCSLDGFSQPYRLKKHDNIKDLSTELAKRYALKCGADYILLDQPVINFRHPTYERFRLWEEPYWCDTYDQILYIDTDIFCWPEAPNLFEIFPGSEFKVAEHWQKQKKSNMLKIKENHLITQGEFKGYTERQLFDISFNAGMFVLTKESKNKMLPYLDFRNTPDSSDDSIVLHKLILDSNVNTLFIDKKWNAKNMRRHHAYFSHLWGSRKNKDENFLPVLDAKELINERQ